MNKKLSNRIYPKRNPSIKLGYAGISICDRIKKSEFFVLFSTEFPYKNWFLKRTKEKVPDILKEIEVSRMECWTKE